jgi:hypothetical protein
MSGAVLAMRRTSPPGFWRGLFAAVTRWRLVSRYPHAGVVVADVLMHSTLTDGVHPEPFNSADGWDLYPTSEPAFVVLERFEVVRGWPYDVFSLLAFGPPIRVRDSSRLYCYELCWYLLTGTMPRERVTAEDLLALVAQQQTTKGAPP